MPKLKGILNKALNDTRSSWRLFLKSKKQSEVLLWSSEFILTLNVYKMSQIPEKTVGCNNVSSRQNALCNTQGKSALCGGTTWCVFGRDMQIILLLQFAFCFYVSLWFRRGGSGLGFHGSAPSEDTIWLTHVGMVRIGTFCGGVGDGSCGRVLVAVISRVFGSWNQRSYLFLC